MAFHHTQERERHSSTGIGRAQKKKIKEATTFLHPSSSPSSRCIFSFVGQTTIFTCQCFGQSSYSRKIRKKGVPHSRSRTDKTDNCPCVFFLFFSSHLLDERVRAVVQSYRSKGACPSHKKISQYPKNMLCVLCLSLSIAWWGGGKASRENAINSPRTCRPAASPFSPWNTQFSGDSHIGAQEQERTTKRGRSGIG